MTSIRGRRQTINSLLLKNTKKVVICTDGTIMVSYEEDTSRCIKSAKDRTLHFKL